MNASMPEDKINKMVGLLLVLAMHGVLLYVAMSYKLIPPPQEAVTLFVNMINPPPKKEEPLPPEPPKPPPKKVELVKEKPVLRPQPAPVLVTEAPVTSPAEPVAPPPQPVIEAPPAPVVEEPVKPAQPVTMTSELSLACPDRSPPNYPAISRRLGEQGQVKLKVELDETGRVTSARVTESSGHKRLDDAGLAAVKSWRCYPAMRDGKPVRAVALQPLDFILN
jgi:protein TonB